MLHNSLKDLEVNSSKDIIIACIYDVDDPRDVLILNSKYKIRKDASEAYLWSILNAGAKIGTCSTRRFSQCLINRPDLTQVAVRGNVQTRINTLHENDLDAVILAYAGIKRLGLNLNNLFILNTMMPAVGQGMLAADILKENKEQFSFLKKLNNKFAYEKVMLERFFLKTIGGPCNSGVGVNFSTFKTCRLEARYTKDLIKTIEVKRICNFKKRYGTAYDIAKYIASKL